MVQNLEVTHKIEAVTRKIQKARAESEAWPMLVVADVLSLAERWAAIRPNVKGTPTFNKWLQSECTGRSWNLGRFKRVQVAIGRLGEHVRRTWTWKAVQWVSGKIVDDELARVMSAYPFWLAGNGGHPLSLEMVKARITEMRAGKTWSRKPKK